MQEVLIHKLFIYTRDNNPELLLQLQGEKSLTDWLIQKVEAIDGTINDLLSKNTPPYEIEKQCMAILTEELKPSRFLYIKKILEEEFERLASEKQTMHFLMCIMAACDFLFEQFSYNEANEDDSLLKYAVIGLIHEYLNKTH